MKTKLPAIVTLPIVVLIFSLSGCGLLFRAPPVGERYFVLQQRACEAAPTTKPIFGSVAVRQLTASDGLDSKRIVFSKSALERGYYQYAFWVSPPTTALTTLLVQELECTGLFSDVRAGYGPRQADVRLEGDLQQFYHDILHSPGEVKIAIRVALIDNTSKETLATRMFKYSIPVETYNAEGAAEAFNKGAAQFFQEITQWLPTAKDFPQHKAFP